MSISFFRFDPANLHIALQVHSQKQPALHCARHKKQKGPLAIEHLPFDFNMIPAKYTAKQFCCNLSLENKSLNIYNSANGFKYEQQFSDNITSRKAFWLTIACGL